VILDLVYFIAGIVLLYYGGDWLVDGASDLGRKCHLRPFVIGALVIGFGTSAPEAFVSVTAQWKGASGLSLGNIVGSSIANIGLILGVVALIHPIQVEPVVIKREYPFLAVVTVILFAFCLRDTLTQNTAWVLLGLFLIFLIWSLKRGKKEEKQEEEMETAALWSVWLKIIFGIVALVIGSELLVRSAVVFARHFGISELIIGTTVVAVGTSLPELAAASVAAARKEGSLALGNIIGSNIFNLLFVSGLALTVRPIPIDAEAHRLLLPALLAFTVLLFPVLELGHHVIRKKAGLVLLVSYATFTVFLFAFRQAP